MRKSQGTEVLRLSALLRSAQSQLAFQRERAENSVSREKYGAVVAGRDALKAESRAKDIVHAEEIAAMKATHKSELEARDLKLKEYEEIQTLLRTENTDFKTLWQFWQGHNFGASSETMTDMMDRIVGRLQCGSHTAARHTAFMYSLAESCRMNGLDFGLYIETVLRRIIDGDTDIHGMQPNVITLPEKAQDTSVA